MDNARGAWELSDVIPAPRALQARRAPPVATVRRVRLGHGANCSSVGSVVDILFVTAAVSGAVVAAICAAMGEEEVRLVGRSGSTPEEEGADKEKDANA